MKSFSMKQFILSICISLVLGLVHNQTLTGVYYGVVKIVSFHYKIDVVPFVHRLWAILVSDIPKAIAAFNLEIGRASCRERV